MRIVAGEFGGRRLQAPKGSGTRPTTERAREALFSILGRLDGLRVLDCFAGSGALGLEALSRGAAHVTFVERDRTSAAVIAANIRTLGVEDRTRLVVADWAAALAAEARARRTYDLILADPPHAEVPAIADALASAIDRVAGHGATVVLEYGATTAPPTLGTLDVSTRQDRTYGDVAFAIANVGSAA